MAGTVRVHAHRPERGRTGRSIVCPSHSGVEGPVARHRRAASRVPASSPEGEADGLWYGNAPLDRGLQSPSLLPGTRGTMTGQDGPHPVHPLPEGRRPLWH
jgi:hypothetical protein